MRRCVGTALAQVTQFDSQQPIGVSGSGHSGRGNGSDEQNMDVSGTARPIATQVRRLTPTAEPADTWILLIEALPCEESARWQIDRCSAD